MLRTVLHHVITLCWTRKQVPTCWKRGSTILIHKKGDTADPSNFRPITLQPVWYKIFSSVYGHRLHTWLKKTGSIDADLQKGFWPGVDGVAEHTEMLTNIMRDAKRHQRSLVVALLDLRNAFGEIHHELIRTALRAHHIPSEFLSLFDSIYFNYRLSISVNETWTKPVTVERGVLQGDPASPLLFSVCFNLLMTTLNTPTYRSLGYTWGGGNKLRQRSWLQFADDAAITASDVKSAQALLNVFIPWCRWAGMDIWLDKCCVFGISKKHNDYVQILLVLWVDSKPVPTVGLDREFKYLGKIFSFKLDNKSAKNLIENKLQSFLAVISGLQIRPQYKIKILKQFVYGQILFDIKIYDFSLD